MDEYFEEKKEMSSIFEQKRHYEKEIEALRKDLEAIEKEETRIKQHLLSDKSLNIADFTLRQDRNSKFEIKRQSTDIVYVSGS